MNPELPEEILAAWEKRDPACVLTTISKNGVPNTIYVSCCGIVGRRRVLICNSAFSKTMENLTNGSERASFLFFAPGLAAYQFKGRIRHHTKGEAFEAGKTFSKPGMPLHGIAEMEVSEAYRGAEQIL